MWMFVDMVGGGPLGWAVDLVLRATVLLALAGVIAAMLVKASAAVRHIVWTVAVAAVLALPVLVAVLPAWRVLPRVAVVEAPRPAVSIDAPQIPPAPEDSPKSSTPCGLPHPHPASSSKPSNRPSTWPCPKHFKLIPRRHPSPRANQFR